MHEHPEHLADKTTNVYRIPGKFHRGPASGFTVISTRIQAIFNAKSVTFRQRNAIFFLQNLDGPCHITSFSIRPRM